jgi:hypothetical protein
MNSKVGTSRGVAPSNPRQTTQSTQPTNGSNPTQIENKPINHKRQIKEIKSSHNMYVILPQEETNPEQYKMPTKQEGIPSGIPISSDINDLEDHDTKYPMEQERNSNLIHIHSSQDTIIDNPQRPVEIAEEKPIAEKTPKKQGRPPHKDKRENKLE